MVLGGAAEAPPPLTQQTPGRLVLVTLQLGVDDGARSAADAQVLPGLHLVLQVGQTPVRVHFELLLWGGDQLFSAAQRKILQAPPTCF